MTEEPRALTDLGGTAGSGPSPAARHLPPALRSPRASRTFRAGSWPAGRSLRLSRPGAPVPLRLRGTWKHRG